MKITKLESDPISGGVSVLGALLNANPMIIASMDEPLDVRSQVEIEGQPFFVKRQATLEEWLDSGDIPKREAKTLTPRYFYEVTSD